MDESKCLSRLLLPLAASLTLQLNACGASSSTTAPDASQQLPLQTAKPKSGATPPLAGRSGAAGACAPSTTTRPIAPGATISGVSANDLLETCVGSHAIALEWQPWWQAPPAVPDIRPLTLEVTASDVPYALDCPLRIASNAEIHLHDKSGALDVTFIGVIEALGPGQFILHGDFHAPQLTAALAVPAAASGTEPDSFVLTASPASGMWQVNLGMQRHAVFCQLMQTAPLQDDECSAYLSETQASRVVTLSTEVADGLAASDLGADFDAAKQRYLHWKDGSTSTLTLAVRLKGFACVHRASSQDLASMTVSNMAEATYVPRWRVVVPVDIHVETTDQRVNATLPGYVSASDGMAGWRSTTTLRTLEIPMNHPLLSEARLGIDRAGTGLSMLMASLSDSESADAQRGSVGLTVYKTDMGLPDFPPVLETTLDRAKCFGSPAASMSRGASIDEQH
jgi:hypothetical protein